jgi:hypothetical protein
LKDAGLTIPDGKNFAEESEYFNSIKGYFMHNPQMLRQVRSEIKGIDVKLSEQKIEKLAEFREKYV